MFQVFLDAEGYITGLFYKTLKYGRYEEYPTHGSETLYDFVPDEREIIKEWLAEFRSQQKEIATWDDETREIYGFKCKGVKQ